MSGTLHLFSGKEILLPTREAVEVALTFWSSVPDRDDVPTELTIAPEHSITITRSSIAAIEKRGGVE
ncbi:MAG TPA: hypothetical protein VHM24_14415 [Gemmatimonadaceae bacterium]|nr:hypothetical protein [Gemmatimonadaceae bacterium]